MLKLITHPKQTKVLLAAIVENFVSYQNSCMTRYRVHITGNETFISHFHDQWDLFSRVFPVFSFNFWVGFRFLTNNAHGFVLFKLTLEFRERSFLLLHRTFIITT